MSTKPQLEASWLAVLNDEFQQEYMQKLRAFLLSEQQQHRIYPRFSLIFNAFQNTPFHDVQVVILGQDPYHGPGQAHGLSFSVQKGTPLPPSLQNIFQELHQDLHIRPSSHGDLSCWAAQGVLLLNTVLTVRHRQAHSHRGQGWERFTDQVINKLNQQRTGLVFVLWGRQAQQKISMIDQQKHLVIRSPHPSPYSADRGFFGSKPFSKINAYLQKQGKKPIDWTIH